MRPVAQTPTEVTDYAALSGLYGTLLAGTALSVRDRPPIPRDEIPVLAAATFALSKLIVHEKVESWIRRPFVDEQPSGRRPKGRRLRYAVGELMSCTRCTGAWCALGLVGLRVGAPNTARTVTTVLAVSAGSDAFHAGFSWLCARADSKKQDAAADPRAVPARAA